MPQTACKVAGVGAKGVALYAREHAGFRAMHQRFIRRHAVAEI